MPLKALPEPSAEEVELGQYSEQLLQLMTGHWTVQAIRSAAELLVTDHVVAGARTSADVAVLEKSDAQATHRLMRACVSLGLLTEEAGMFSVTPLGNLLRQDVPGSLREIVLAQGGHGIWQTLGLMPEAVRSGRNQSVAAVGAELFDYFSLHPGEGQLFSRAMSNVTGLVIEDAVQLVDLDGAEVVVDVGGAEGALLLGLLAAHPEVTGRLLDLPNVIPDGQRAAEKAGVQDRFAAVAGDFFTSVPAGNYYLLKWILHDWSDEECVTILRNCRKAAAPGARALVIEAVVAENGERDYVALLDMNMLAGTNGRERSRAEFDALFHASGWERTAISPTRSFYQLQELRAV